MPEEKHPRYLTRNTPGIVIETEPVSCSTIYRHKENNRYGGDVHKLDVGAELNRLVGLADAIVAGKVSPLDHFKFTAAELANDLYSVVDRVATFEELETEPETV